MDRLVLLVFTLVAQVGCQSPSTGYGLFAPQQTRVPPPPTGVIGDGGNYYSAPSLNTGASSAPVHPLTHVPGEQITNVGRWRYWEAANANSQQRDRSGADPRTDSRRSDQLGAGPPEFAQQPNESTRLATSRPKQSLATRRQPTSGLQKNDRLAWQSPAVPAPSYTEFVTNNVPVGSSYAPPQYLPATGPVTPIAAPVRVRGFPNSYGRQSIGIPAELAQFRNNGVRQASASSSSWQPRYEDARR